MGYIIPFFMVLLGSLFSISFYEYNFNTASDLNIMVDFMIVWVFLSLAIVTGYQMNRKYYQDLRNNKKIAEPRLIQKKIAKKDFEAGSGNFTTLPHNKEMKEFIRYDLIIDNTKYRINKALFDTCADGDEVIFYYAPISKKLLSIEKDQVTSTFY